MRRKRAALLVGDAVERASASLDGGDRLVDRMRGGAGVEVHRPLAALVGPQPDPPLGMEALARLGRHPVGERLVEPEVVPPGHGDQVAEPLVRDLVRDHAVDAPAGSRSGVRRRVDEQRGLGVDDRAPVLHRPAEAAGHGRSGRAWAADSGCRSSRCSRAAAACWRRARTAPGSALPAVTTTPSSVPSTTVRHPLELARDQREQVARHPRRRCELPGAARRPAGASRATTGMLE